MIGGSGCYLLPVRSDVRWQNVLWREQCPEIVGNTENEGQSRRTWIVTGNKKAVGIHVVCFVPLSGDLSHAELMMMTIADIIKQLIEAHEQGKDVNLNK